MKKEIDWKNNEEYVYYMYQRLAELKGNEPFKASKWKRHCRIVAEMMRNKFNDDRFTPEKIEAQTILPPFNSKVRFGPATAKYFAIAILSGWIIPEDLNKTFVGKS